MTTILLTGGGGAASEAIYRLLDDGYRLHFADADPDARPPSVPASAWHVVPYASAPEFVERLHRLCVDLAIDLLVPGVDEELPPVAHARTTFPCDVLLPPASFVDTHLDKLASNAALRASGIAVPDTEPLHDRRRVTFPCIVKPRRGRGSRHVAIVHSDEALRAHVLLSGCPADSFIVQEYLRGEEYTVTVVADRQARLRAIVPVHVQSKKGITVRGETAADASVIAACAAIHAAQPVGGCFNIQMVKTDAAAVMPFEINPRISTTTCLAIAAGVDVFGLYLDASGTPDIPRLAAFEDGLRLKRSWHNEFVRQ